MGRRFLGIGTGGGREVRNGFLVVGTGSGEYRAGSESSPVEFS